MTHRDVNQSVTFVTGHDQNGETPSTINWEAISNGSQVIVIYMGMRHIKTISSSLINCGRDPTEPVAIVTKATLPNQFVLETTLESCVRDVTVSNIKPPAIICIGKSVLMRQVLDWQSQIGGEKPRNTNPLNIKFPSESA